MQVYLEYTISSLAMPEFTFFTSFAMMRAIASISKLFMEFYLQYSTSGVRPAGDSRFTYVETRVAEVFSARK